MKNMATNNFWLPAQAGTVQSCRLVATFTEVVKDLLRTDVLGGRADAWVGLAMVGPVTPPNLVGASARRGVVYLRESPSISKTLYSRTCIGHTTDLPAGWLGCGLMHGRRTRSRPTSV